MIGKCAHQGWRWMLILGILLVNKSVKGEEPPLKRPTIPAIKVNEPPKIDGFLDEPLWQKAAKITGFWRTDRDELAKEQTEVLICYDEKSIYVAFLCNDSQPQLIRAQQRKRGGDLSGDDIIAVNIDPLNQPRVFGDTTYSFFVNPLGTQNEEVPGGAAVKIEWRGDWQVKTKITEKGWQAEIAIPFRIFRLPMKPKAFGIWFSRDIPPPRLEYSAFPYRRGQAVGNTAEWGPLDLPKFKFPMLFMLSTSLALGGNEDEGVRNGLDIKQHLPNGLQWQTTFNPDFRNVEDVVETIDFTYVPRSLPDRRPFFTEGRSYFPPSFMFYSRNIQDVLAGTKLFGKVGRTEVGILNTYETHSHLTLASRFGYDLDKKWSLEADYAHRTGTGRSPVYRLAFNGNVPSGRHWIWNYGGDLVYGGADTWSLNFGCSPTTPGRFSFFLNYGEIGEYRPSVGFKPEVNFREFFGNISYFDRYDKGTVLQWGCFAYHSWRRLRGGPKKGQLLDRNEYISGFILGRKGWLVHAGYNRYQRPPFQDQILNSGFGWNVFDRFRSGSVSYWRGKRAGKNYSFLTLNQSFRLSDRWSLNLRYENLQHEQRTYQLVFSGVYDLTPERSLIFRWVKGSAPKPGAPKTLLPIDNIYLGFRQFSRKGLDIYLLLGDPNERHTQFNLLVKVIKVF
ncbi:MAG: carbohydrate binding family 9 domain-containing protein [Candidatus Bathyarchaeia archaeon]